MYEDLTWAFWFDLYNVVEATICSHFNNFFFVITLPFNWDSFGWHLNPSIQMLKTGTWMIVIEAWSIIFHNVSAPLLYTKLAHTLNCGTNLLTSCCQLCSVEAGATTRNGPQILCVYRYNQNDHILINNLSYYSSTSPFYHTGALEHTKKGHSISQ